MSDQKLTPECDGVTYRHESGCPKCAEAREGLVKYLTEDEALEAYLVACSDESDLTALLDKPDSECCRDMRNGTCPNCG
jgi:hypothetical protein